jgi:hypothetical protein
MQVEKLDESRSLGRVTRVVDDSLAYAMLEGSGRTISFAPNVLENYRGESFAELSVTEGTIIECDWIPALPVVVRASILNLSLARGSSDDAAPIGLPSFPTRTKPAEKVKEAQLELHPDRAPGRKIGILRAIPIATRKFGKLVDTSNLAPADLLLSRDLHPDRISTLITNVQTEGGYDRKDSRWTHAAMYLGDGASVVEATFDDPLSGGNVRLTSLDEYCQGECSLRFRRSRFLKSEREAWQVCVRAMSRLGRPYNFLQAVTMWFNVVFQGHGFFSDEIRRPTSAAVICSMLYADSYNEATRRSLGEVSGVCVPAWLSASDEFDDVQAEWAAF